MNGEGRLHLLSATHRESMRTTTTQIVSVAFTLGHTWYARVLKGCASRGGCCMRSSQTSDGAKVVLPGGPDWVFFHPPELF